MWLVRYFMRFMIRILSPRKLFYGTRIRFIGNVITSLTHVRIHIMSSHSIVTTICIVCMRFFLLYIEYYANYKQIKRYFYDVQVGTYYNQHIILYTVGKRIKLIDPSYCIFGNFQLAKLTSDASITNKNVKTWWYENTFFFFSCKVRLTEFLHSMRVWLE